MPDPRPTLDITTSITQMTVRAEGRTEVSAQSATGEVTVQTTLSPAVQLPLAAESAAIINLNPAESVKLDLATGPAVDLTLNLGASAVYTAGPPSASQWGIIGGDLEDQADLTEALDDLSDRITTLESGTPPDVITESDVTTSGEAGLIPRLASPDAALNVGSKIHLVSGLYGGNQMVLQAQSGYSGDIRYLSDAEERGTTLVFPNPLALSGPEYPSQVRLPSLPGASDVTLATLDDVADIATEEEAEAGTNTEKMMTPALTKHAIDYFGGGGGGGGGGLAVDPDVAYIRSTGDDISGTGAQGSPFLTPSAAYAEGFRYFDIGTEVLGDITTTSDEILHIRGRDAATASLSIYTHGHNLTVYATDVRLDRIDLAPTDTGADAGALTVYGTKVVIDRIIADGSAAPSGSESTGGAGGDVTLQGSITVVDELSMQGGAGDGAAPTGAFGDFTASQGVICPAPVPNQANVKGAVINGTFYANQYGSEYPANWGYITGDIATQGDLQTALSAKASTADLGTAAFANVEAFATPTDLEGRLALTGGTMTGFIEFNSGQTFDGRLPGLDGSKLDGIEPGADVTDAANVTAAGAVMESDTSVAGFSFVLDEDDMASNSATKLPTQQSVKAYVDAHAGGSPAWGDISGTLADQTDLQSALDGRLALSGGTLSGNLSFTGAQTVDGRDVSADGTKLDGIEAGADVTDAANVAAAGAVMETDTSVSGFSFVLDEDDMASNSATKLPTQQSVKAYVDAHSGASPAWGSITGTLADQTDLQAALDALSGSTGDVVGPASAVNNHVPQWDGTTGKLLKSGLGTSGGGAGAADSGMLAVYGSTGELLATTRAEVRDIIHSSRKGILTAAALVWEDVENTGYDSTLAPISGGLTASRTWTLPDATGTLALTSEIPLLGVTQVFVRFSGVTNNNVAATYSRTLTTVTVTLNNHGYIVGNVVQADFTSGTAVDGLYTITSVATNTFTFTTAASGTTSGNVTLLRNTIGSSSGVHSVTDSGTANYYVNFSAAFADANFFFTATAGSSGANRIAVFSLTPTQQTIRITTLTTAMAAADSDFVCFTAMR